MTSQVPRELLAVRDNMRDTLSKAKDPIERPEQFTNRELSEIQDAIQRERNALYVQFDEFDANWEHPSSPHAELAQIKDDIDEVVSSLAKVRHSRLLWERSDNSDPFDNFAHDTYWGSYRCVPHSTPAEQVCKRGWYVLCMWEDLKNDAFRKSLSTRYETRVSEGHLNESNDLYSPIHFGDSNEPELPRPLTFEESDAFFLRNTEQYGQGRPNLDYFLLGLATLSDPDSILTILHAKYSTCDELWEHLERLTTPDRWFEQGLITQPIAAYFKGYYSWRSLGFKYW